MSNCESSIQRNDIKRNEHATDEKEREEGGR